MTVRATATLAMVALRVYADLLEQPSIETLGRPYEVAVIDADEQLTPACGIWKIIKLDLDLEASVPHGKWFLTAEAITTKSLTPDQ
jgi:hypothetical protein